MRACVKAVVLSALAGLTLAACSSSGSSQSVSTTSTTGAPQVSTPTTISTAAATAAIAAAAAAAAYEAAAQGANVALASFGSKANAWTSGTTNTQAEADAQPAIAALQSFNTTHTNGQWPAAATSDVHTLVGDTGALIGDLQGLSTVNLLNASSWTATFQRDVQMVSSAVGLVRHDLGLPAATPAG